MISLTAYHFFRGHLTLEARKARLAGAPHAPLRRRSLREPGSPPAPPARGPQRWLGRSRLCEHLLVVGIRGIDLRLNTADPVTLVIDLNCAFASIEQQHDPKLRGRPLAIAAYATASWIGVTATPCPKP